MSHRSRFVAAVMLAISLTGCGGLDQRGVPGNASGQTARQTPGSTATTSQSPAPAQPKSDALIPAYEVIDRDSYDAPIKTQITLSAVVSGPLTEPGLKQLLSRLFDEANATRGFKYHGGKPTHVFVFLYISREHFKSGMGQWIAMTSRAGEDSRIDTQVKSELMAQLNAKPEVRFGLSEVERQEIFGAILKAERSADTTAQSMYPVPDVSKPGYSQAVANDQIQKQGEAFNTLVEKNKSELAERYGLTKEQLRDISTEGIKKSWPMR